MPDHLRSFLFDRCRCIDDSCKPRRGDLFVPRIGPHVLVLSEAVLSPPRRTVLVLDGCLNCGDAGR